MKMNKKRNLLQTR